MSGIILVEFKKGKKGPKKQPEAYTSIPGFVERYPLYSKYTIEHYLSRLKKPFEDDKLKVTRIELFGREKDKKYDH